MFFFKGLLFDSSPTHYIHMVESDSILWESLVFRDYLQQHPEEAQRYEQLKYNLAENHRRDREAYRKNKYIESIM